MQTDPRYLTHINTKECHVGTERQHQRDMAVQSALALRQQFTVHGDILGRVEVFRYLGCLLLQDDNYRLVVILAGAVSYGSVMFQKKQGF
jgi:hypothetical protein